MPTVYTIFIINNTNQDHAYQISYPGGPNKTLEVDGNDTENEVLTLDAPTGKLRNNTRATFNYLLTIFYSSFPRQGTPSTSATCRLRSCCKWSWNNGECDAHGSKHLDSHLSTLSFYSMASFLLSPTRKEDTGTEGISKDNDSLLTETLFMSMGLEMSS
jgi:hypothetical protein